MSENGNMYARAQTWNPFKGCRYDCVYCIPSFQRQAKRQKNRCADCYNYTPHTHPERLKTIPSAPIIFVCGNGDIAFCPDDFMQQILDRIKKGCETNRSTSTFYLQTKDPAVLAKWIPQLPRQVVLVTTLETNRDDDYLRLEVSKAPPPSERYLRFLQLPYKRKIVTIEPLMDFDLHEFAQMVIDVEPECVWIGFNSRSMDWAPEPSPDKATALMGILQSSGIPIKGKTLRGMADRKEEP